MWQPCAKYKRTPPAVRLQPPFHPSSFSTQDRIASGRIVDKKQPTRFRRRQPFVRSFPRRIAVRDLRTDSSYASVSLSAIPYRVRKRGQRQPASRSRNIRRSFQPDERRYFRIRCTQGEKSFVWYSVISGFGGVSESSSFCLPPGNREARAGAFCYAANRGPASPSPALRGRLPRSNSQRRARLRAPTERALRRPVRPRATP